MDNFTEKSSFNSTGVTLGYNEATYNSSHNMSDNGKHFIPPNTGELMYMWTITVFMVTFNIPVFLIIPKVKSLPDTSRIVMLSLAVTDISLGFTLVFRFSYYEYIHDYYVNISDWRCYFDGFASVTFAGASVFHLSFVLLDRLILVSKPLHYSQLMTKSTIYAICISLWLFSILFGLILVFEVGDARVKFFENAFYCAFDPHESVIYTSMLLLFYTVFPSFIIAASFIGLFRAAHKQARAIGAQESAFSSSNEFEKNKKIIRTLTFMIIGFYTFWAPYFVFCIFWDMIFGKTVQEFELYASYLATGNSFINPLIYVPTIKEYREILISYFRKLKCF